MSWHLLGKDDFVLLKPGGSSPVPPVGLGAVSLRTFPHALHVSHVPMTAGCSCAQATQKPLAENNTDAGFFGKTSLCMMRRMSLGLSELGGSSEQLLLGLAATAGLLGGSCVPHCFLFSEKGSFPLGTPILSPFPLPHCLGLLSPVCPHLHCPALVKADGAARDRECRRVEEVLRDVV